jgi:hypothetical protein
MMMIETTIVLLSSTAAWNLAGAQTPPATQTARWLTYQSRDLFFVFDRPSAWEYHTEEDSNEVVFLRGNLSVSVAVANNDEGNTVDQFLEVNKSLLRQRCPAPEVREEGKATVAGAPGAYFTMYCPGPRLPAIVRISAAANYGKFFIFNVTVPSAELPAAQAEIDQMARSFKASDGLPEGHEPRKRAR